MRKCFVRLMTCLLIACAFLNVSGDGLAETSSMANGLQYTLTKKTLTTLSISARGKATCKGYIRADSLNSTIKIKVKLMRKIGKTWKLYHKWDIVARKDSAELIKTCTVKPGTYKLIVTAIVKSAGGKIEIVSQSSAEKTYS